MVRRIIGFPPRSVILGLPGFALGSSFQRERRGSAEARPRAGPKSRTNPTAMITHRQPCRPALKEYPAESLQTLRRVLLARSGWPPQGAMDAPILLPSMGAGTAGGGTASGGRPGSAGRCYRPGARGSATSAFAPGSAPDRTRPSAASRWRRCRNRPCADSLRAGGWLVDQRVVLAEDRAVAGQQPFDVAGANPLSDVMKAWMSLP